jgi:cytochrome c oxidase assembly factor CtaG
MRIDDAHAFGPSLWDFAAMSGLVAMAIGYAIGAWRLARRGARVRTVERAAFWTGWIATFAAVAPPLDTAAQSTFSMHMLQHELLIVIGAPLLIVGRPIVPLLWALPSRSRSASAVALQHAVVGGAWRTLTTPVIAWLLHGMAMWVWHVPTLYEAALASESIHALQHATFIGTGVLFWWGLIYGRYGRLAYGASALFLFMTMVHTGVLGALFALSTAPYYPVYAARAASAGVDAVSDQQLAGLYMWIPAGIVLMVSGLALVVAWIAEADRRTRSRAVTMWVAMTAAGLISSACVSMAHEKEVRMLTGGDPRRGRSLIQQYGCDSCHTIPGIATADAAVGPPLTDIALRVYLAGHIENTPENMIRWIQHPRRYDEKTAMPEMGVSDADSRDIAAYLYTLR